MLGMGDWVFHPRTEFACADLNKYLLSIFAHTSKNLGSPITCLLISDHVVET